MFFVAFVILSCNKSPDELLSSFVCPEKRVVFLLSFGYVVCLRFFSCGDFVGCF